VLIIALVLLVGSESPTPAAVATVATLLNDPDAEPRTVPLIVITTEPPAGKVGIAPVTLLPETLMFAGHTAPPAALVQLALTPLTDDGTRSEKVVSSAALTPKAFEMVSV
jgi:hypothetical protein